MHYGLFCNLCPVQFLLFPQEQKRKTETCRGDEGSCFTVRLFLYRSAFTFSVFVFGVFSCLLVSGDWFNSDHTLCGCESAV